MVPAATGLAGAMLGAAAPMAGQVASDTFNAFAGNATGRAATAGLSANPTLDALKRAGVMLNPQQEAMLASELANQAAKEEMGRNINQQAIGASLGNTAGNLNAQRTMAINAQQNAADNVRNQLNNLANARQNAAMNATSAIQGAAQLFR